MKRSRKSLNIDQQPNDLAPLRNADLKLRFPIVGIGASAGGLEALEQFFTHIPANSGMAFVVIQHLDPTQTGIMGELIQRMTAMNVLTVTDRLMVQPNYVYVIPSNKSMSILNGALHLFDPVETRGLRLPVDFFFRSLANDLEELSIGIILSGMGSDGSLGIKAIKEKAGRVLVQDPETAKFASMPRYALEAVLPDVVAPADELPQKLLALLKVPAVQTSISDLDRDFSSLEKIVILLRNQTGNDFSQYKKTTLYRRIERRMSIHQISKINLYVHYLQQNPTEVEILFRELLIGVTGFFRDPAVWEYIKNKVIPEWIVRYPSGHTIRAWIPGCSTGEEAFSFAMIFREAMQISESKKNLILQIFATDLDNDAIDRARKGVYPDNIIADVSPERLERFFVKSQNRYRVNADIREMVVFATHNVIKDPPFTKLDFLSCRNLLIYMNSALQKKVLALFHYSLNQEGTLLLGNAETTSSHPDLFLIIDSKLRIYKSAGLSKTDELFHFPDSFSQPKRNLMKNQMPSKPNDNIQSLTDQILLQQFLPASVLVTTQGDILYITGDTSKYLALAAGKVNLNLFAMARDGLRDLLPSAFRKAAQGYEKIVLSNVPVGTSEGVHLANITIRQIEEPEPLKDKILVIFAEAPPGKKSPLQKSGKASNRTLHEACDQEIKSLREELQSLREEMQTSQEELKSTNEELQSTNEELQSTNEELTTSKEEMQSLNEELHIVNAEMQNKIDDSARESSDMQNLLNSTEIATLFLDRELRVRRFTIPSTDIFKLIPSDIGRLFTDQVTDLDYPDMYEDAKSVLHSLVTSEKIVTAKNGRWFRVRIMPYRTFDDKIDGLVITFIDISKFKWMEYSLMENSRILHSFIDSIPSVIIGVSSIGNIIEFNPQAEKLFERKKKEVLGHNYFDLFIPESSRIFVKGQMDSLLAGQLPNRFENSVKSASGKEFRIDWSAHKLLDENGLQVGIIALGANIKRP